jgi:nitrous oxidase accessory protein NosD
MTTFHVAAHGHDGNPGTAAAPWRSLQRAAGAVQPGDTVTIHPGLYPGATAITTPDTTWSGHGLVLLDGGWNGRTTAIAEAVISIQAPQTVIEGLQIANAPMHAIAVRHPAQEVLIRNCIITHPARDGIHAFGRTSGRHLVIVNCTISHAGRAARLKPSLVGDGIRIRSGHGCVIAGTTVDHAGGSGIFIDRGARDTTVYNCTLVDNGGAAVRIGNARGTDIDGNCIYLTRRPKSARTVRPDGILLADEIHRRPSHHTTIRDNLIVNCETLLRLKTDRNRHGHATSLDAGSSIHHNTFVAGPWTRDVLRIDDNRERSHGAAAFRDNVIHGDHAPDAALVTGPPRAIDAGNNAWSREPPAAWHRPGDIIGFRLVRETAVLHLDEALNEEAFAPPADSPLVGRATDGSAIGALEPNL